MSELSSNSNTVPPHLERPMEGGRVVPFAAAARAACFSLLLHTIQPASTRDAFDGTCRTSFAGTTTIAWASPPFGGTDMNGRGADADATEGWVIYAGTLVGCERRPEEVR